jgi:Rnl2 family RNA ligase
MSSNDTSRDAPGKFVKYDKMGEDSGSVGASVGTGPANAYVVTEKVHGANFCIIASFEHGLANAPTVHFAKRTAILGGVDNAEDFYSCRSSGLLRTLAPRGEAVLQSLAAAARGAGEEAPEAVHVYGELFGGSYPHPDVQRSPGIEAVQMGIWYAPDLHFMGFDVAYESVGSRTFLNYDSARDVCERCGLLFAAPLFRGSLSECLDYPIEYDTTIPARLGLPPLSADAAGNGRNLAEGVVIRPQAEPTARCTSGVRIGKESARGLFKRKIAAFSEKRFQNDDWKRSKGGGGGTVTVTEEGLVGLEMAACITEQRLANVLSKIGCVDPKNKDACRALLEDFKEDVREALEENDQQLLRSSQKLQAELEALCKAVITQELLGKSQRGRRGK